MITGDLLTDSFFFCCCWMFPSLVSVSLDDKQIVGKCFLFCFWFTGYSIRWCKVIIARTVINTHLFNEEANYCVARKVLFCFKRVIEMSIFCSFCFIFFSSLIWLLLLPDLTSRLNYRYSDKVDKKKTMMTIRALEMSWIEFWVSFVF